MDITTRKPDGTFECYTLNMREPEGNRKTVNKEASESITSHVRRVEEGNKKLRVLEDHTGPRGLLD